MISRLRKCLELIGPEHRLQGLGLVLLATGVGVAEALSAALVFLLLGVLTVRGDREGMPEVPGAGLLPEGGGGLLAVIAFVAAFFVLRAALSLFQSASQYRVANRIGVGLSSRLLRAYLYMPYPAHLQRNSSELIRNAHDSVYLFVQQVLVTGVSLFSEVLLVAAIATVLLMTAPGATVLVCALLAPIVFVLLRTLQPRLVRLGEISQDALGESIKALQQSLHGVRDIKVLGREEGFHERFVNVRETLAGAYARRAFLLDVPRVVIETSLMVTILGALGLAIAAGRDTERLMAVLGLFAYAGLRILPSLNRIMTSLNMMRYGRAVIDELYRDVEAAEAATLREPEGDAPFTFTERLVLDDVSFRYVGADRDALSHVSFDVLPGESIGVVGPTGGGKSTLIDVILGLLSPTDGQITVDGTPLEACVAGFRAQIGLVPQTIFLVDDTLRRNIALGVHDEDIDHRAVEEAVGAARLQELVTQLPEGLDTVVGERGVKLSGGQRQRVAIARALYRRPKLLLFDEGTSALDTETESEVIEALSKLRGRRTVLLVAHRLTTVRDCDRILVVADGCIVAQGTYDELLTSSALFQRLAGDGTVGPGAL